MRTSSAVATLNSDDTEAVDSARSICESSETDSLVRRDICLSVRPRALRSSRMLRPMVGVQLVLAAEDEALLLRDALDDLAELVDARTAS